MSKVGVCTRLVKNFCLAGMLIYGASCFAAADLGWDLTYKNARLQANMGKNEFMQVWPRDPENRQIQQKIAQYSGEKIERSILIEKPDGHTGDPYASWIIVTKSSATICNYHPKIEEKCKSLDIQKSINAIEKIYHFKPLENVDLHKRTIDKNVGINYIGFLSIYINGKQLQRPIAFIEEVGIADIDEIDRLGDQVGRLGHAIASILLSDDEIQQNKIALEKQTTQRRFLDATVAGDLVLMQQLINANVETGHIGAFEINQSLPLAAGANHKAVIDFLLQQGANIDSKESAALKAAVKAKNIDMINYLISIGAYVDPPPETSDYYGRTYSSPLGEAVFANDIEIAKVLIQKGADVNFIQSRAIITKAVLSRNEEMVDFLLSQGADPDGISNEGYAAETTLSFLMRSKLDGVVERMIRRLVKSGANVNFISKRCDTYLSQIEFWTRDQNMRKLMIELGAKPDAQEDCFKATWTPEQYQKRQENLKKYKK